MVSINATDFKNMIQNTSITAANAELLIDQAVNRLNTYGCELPNMTGTAGSKTLSVESREAGAIYEVARLIYYGYYVSQESGGITSLSVTSPNMLSNPIVEGQIEKLARQLSEMDVSVV